MNHLSCPLELQIKQFDYFEAFILTYYSDIMVLETQPLIEYISLQYLQTFMRLDFFLGGVLLVL